LPLLSPGCGSRYYNFVSYFIILNGAHDQDRTDDLILTKDVLYQLSYMGTGQIQFRSADPSELILIPVNDKKPIPLLLLN
jgi:hypothetical protein